MRSLFLRVFLWFWLAMALVVALLVVTSPFFTRSRPALEDWHESAEEWARSRVDRVAAHITEHGAEDSRIGRGEGRRGRGGRHAPTRLFVLDENQVELWGGDAPAEVHDLARRASAADEERSERAGTVYLVAAPVVDPQGRRLVVVVAHHSPPRLIHLLEPSALAWRLGILVLVVGGLSFWLARYLSSPVDALRQATRRLSGGDFSTRVGSRVAHRKDEIGELARDFDSMTERIEGLLEAQQRLLRDVSHELRSPLARLVVALELARSRAGEAATESLDRIGREAGRLDELIGRLLLLERLEAGGVEEEAVELDLVDLLAEVAADAGYEAAATDRRVRFTPCPPVMVHGRPDFIRSAFENVIRNAVHHTGAGTAVEIDLARVDDGVEVVVRDFGPGVAESDLENIFEPFFRVGEDRDRSSGGVGLGLSIARRAIERHGGALRAANHEDGGMEILAYLPVREPHRELSR